MLSAPLPFLFALIDVRLPSQQDEHSSPDDRTPKAADAPHLLTYLLTYFLT